MGDDDANAGGHMLPANFAKVMLAAVHGAQVTAARQPPTRRQRLAWWADDWRFRISRAWRALRGDDFGGG